MKFNIYKIYLIAVLFLITTTAFAQHCPAGQVEVFFNLTGTINGNVPALGLDTDKNGAPDTWINMYDANNTSSTGSDGWYQCAVCLAENTQYWYIYRDGAGTWEGANLSTAFNNEAGCGTTSWEGNPCYDCPVRAGATWAQRVLDVGTTTLNVHETIGQCPSARDGGGAFTHYETRNIQVLPSLSGNITATDRVHNSDGWVSFWNDNNTATDFSDDYILMSVKLDNVPYWNLQYNRAKVNAPAAGEAQWHASDPNTFITNPNGGSGRLQRIWSYDWTNALTADAGVRFYYTDSEFSALNTQITNNGGTALIDATEMQLYKVTSNDFAWDIPNLAIADIQIINYNTTPSTTNFSTYSNGSNLNYVEFEVAAFNNKGGGIVGTSGGGDALPVELVRFTGELQAQNVLLKWTTASEEENDYFSVEHSLDGREFHTIGQVDGSGNSFEMLDYEFTHEQPANGVNYYRLVPVAFDGTVEYSEVIAVALEKDGKLSIFPTLTSNVLNINYESDAVDVLIYNQVGVEMMRQNLPLNNNTQELSVADLPNGVYFLIIQDGNVRRTVKFVKQ